MPVYVIPLVMMLIQALPGLIHTAEEAFSGKPGSGQAKKDLVLQGSGAAIDLYRAIQPNTVSDEHAKAIMGAVSSLTDATVQVFNTYKLFRQGGK